MPGSSLSFRRELEARIDPIFAALGVLHEAQESHAARLRNLDDAVLSSRNAATKAMIAWDLYRLQDLEVAQVQAASALLDAEATCLTLPPTTLAGSIAVLMFLKDYLKAEPDLSLAVIGVGNVAAMLSTIA